MSIPEIQLKIQQIFFNFEIIVFEFVALGTRFYWEREYLSSGVNMLTKILKISDTIKKEFFEVISFQSDKKIWGNYCYADLSIFSDYLTCSLSISFLTRVFLGI